MMHLELYNLLLAYLLFGWFPTKICQLDRPSVVIVYFTYLILRKKKKDTVCVVKNLVGSPQGTDNYFSYQP